MSSAFSGLTPRLLLILAGALEGERLLPEFTRFGLQKYVSGPERVLVAEELNRLHQMGMTPVQLAYTLRLLAEEREATQRARDCAELVWSGPEIVGSQTRETGVVVRELFANARREVLVSGFTVYQGTQIFQKLADRMDENEGLSVRMFLNIPRKWGETKPSEELVEAFAQKFWKRQWPGERRPEVYYDPRSLEREEKKQTSLHAKCVVIDGERAFVTSANFTEAAQERNIEAGILLHHPSIAKSLCSQFDSLVAAGMFQPLPEPDE